MELPKKFNSRESEEVRFFLDRSPAVAGLIFALTKEGIKVLIGRRSNSMKDCPGLYGIPCGYLNWDETLYEAMMRETYEETSFYIPDYKDHLIYNHNKFPFLIKDHPSETHQNVTSIFISVFDFENVDNSFIDEINNFTCKESEWTRWIPINDIKTMGPKHWAFKHDKTIKKGIDLIHNILPSEEGFTRKVY